jgi:hypothetical protein
MSSSDSSRYLSLLRLTTLQTTQLIVNSSFQTRHEACNRLTPPQGDQPSQQLRPKNKTFRRCAGWAPSACAAPAFTAFSTASAAAKSLEPGLRRQALCRPVCSHSLSKNIGQCLKLCTRRLSRLGAKSKGRLRGAAHSENHPSALVSYGRGSDSCLRSARRWTTAGCCPCA